MYLRSRSGRKPGAEFESEAIRATAAMRLRYADAAMRTRLCGRGYAAAAVVYERRSASSTKRLTAGDQKNPTCPPA